jgi:hypothetical protein
MAEGQPQTRRSLGFRLMRDGFHAVSLFVIQLHLPRDAAQWLTRQRSLSALKFIPHP